MVIRDTQSLGQYLAYQRRQIGWTQQDLADRLGSTQAWVSALERGKPGAGIGQVLRAVAELSLQLRVCDPSTSGDHSIHGGKQPNFDLNAYIDSARFLDAP